MISCQMTVERRKRRRSFGTGALVQLLIFLGGTTIGMDLFLLCPNAKVKTWLTPPERLIPIHRHQKHSQQLKNQQQTNSTIPQQQKQPPPSTDMSRDHVVRILQSMGANVTNSQQLPTYQQVVDQVGPQPVVVGLETCQKFRDSVPAVDRMLGAAGLFSTGTNLVTQLLKQNCVIPARREKFGPHATREDYGMRWQVPWGKHTPAHFKNQHATDQAQKINKDHVLPIVTIRNPWRWMQSMCKNPYAARWAHHRVCPQLQKDGSWNNVTVTYGAGAESYTSLIHLYHEWYEQYRRADYPRLLIRMEDLIFRPKAVVGQVCECAGGSVASNFQYIQDSAKKDSPGHDTSVGLVEAWIRYSRPLEVMGGLDASDYHAATDYLQTTDWMKRFHYPAPPGESQQ